MPEGDTLFRIAATLRVALANQLVVRFETNLPELQHDPRLSSIPQRRVHAIEARGKHLLIVLRNDALESDIAVGTGRMGLDLIRSDLVLHTHLRMTGSWHIYRTDEPWQKPHRYMKAAIHISNFVAPCFSAPVVELLSARDAARHAGLVELGPDATTDSFDPEDAKSRILARPEAQIGVAIMNQRLMAGVGNVYKSEVLFIQRIDPFAPVSSLTDSAIALLVVRSHRLLIANRMQGDRRTASNLNMRNRLWVYGKDGKPCQVCGAEIRMRRQGLEGRVTFFCPECQGVSFP